MGSLGGGGRSATVIGRSEFGSAGVCCDFWPVGFSIVGPGIFLGEHLIRKVVLSPARCIPLVDGCASLFCGDGSIKIRREVCAGASPSGVADAEGACGVAAASEGVSVVVVERAGLVLVSVVCVWGRVRCKEHIRMIEGRLGLEIEAVEVLDEAPVVAVLGLTSIGSVPRSI